MPGDLRIGFEALRHAKRDVRLGTLEFDLIHRQVAQQDGIVDRPADPRPGKHRLGGHRASQQAGEVCPDDSYQGHRGIAQGVPA